MSFLLRKWSLGRHARVLTYFILQMECINVPLVYLLRKNSYKRTENSATTDSLVQLKHAKIS